MGISFRASDSSAAVKDAWNLRSKYGVLMWNTSRWRWGACRVPSPGAWSAAAPAPPARRSGAAHARASASGRRASCAPPRGTPCSARPPTARRPRADGQLQRCFSRVVPQRHGRAVRVLHPHVVNHRLVRFHREHGIVVRHDAGAERASPAQRVVPAVLGTQDSFSPRSVAFGLRKENGLLCARRDCRIHRDCLPVVFVHADLNLLETGATQSGSSGKKSTCKNSIVSNAYVACAARGPIADGAGLRSTRTERLVVRSNPSVANRRAWTPEGGGTVNRAATR